MLEPPPVVLVRGGFGAIALDHEKSNCSPIIAAYIRRSLIGSRLVEIIQPFLNGLNSRQNNFDPFKSLLGHAIRVVDAAGHRNHSFGQRAEFGGHVGIVDKGGALTDVVITHAVHHPPAENK